MKKSNQPVSLSACQLKGKPSKWNFFSDYRLFKFILFALVMTGCVPATVPSQLIATPGRAVIITEQQFDAGIFRVRYPPGWRVITGAATNPASVIFVSPDNMAIIQVATDAIEAPMPQTDEPIRADKRQIKLDNGLTVTAILNAPENTWERFVLLFDQTIESVR
jgi:hypothetical protein